jgi:hypothetical protein
MSHYDWRPFLIYRRYEEFCEWLESSKRANFEIIARQGSNAKRSDSASVGSCSPDHVHDARLR